jgi:DNA-binding beta-propeller fold protein YncE
MRIILALLFVTSILVACHTGKATDSLQNNPASSQAVAETTEFEPVSPHLLYVLDPHSGDSSTAIHVVDAVTLGVIHVIEAKYDPQIAVSPDGTRLYLTDMRSDGTDMLSIIETGTWNVLAEMKSPDRIKHKVYGSDAMALSLDGRYLYIHKWKLLPEAGRFTGPGGHSAPKADHWWDVFDTTTGEFSPTPPHIPDCGIAKAMPLPDGKSLAVLCFQRSELVFVDLTTGDTLQTISTRKVTHNRAFDPILQGDAAAAVLSFDRRHIFVSTADGRILVVDAAQREVVQTIHTRSPSDVRVSYSALVVGVNQLYVGVGGQVWTYDTNTWQRTATSQASGVPFSLALSPDVKRFYAANPNNGTLTVFDAANGQKLNATRLSETPSVIVVVPPPP